MLVEPTEALSSRFKFSQRLKSASSKDSAGVRGISSPRDKGRAEIEFAYTATAVSAAIQS